ncbi:hypothetical protein SOVF_149140 [Spinacia oleracea]|nr:hypothetical protein SOVF_149140 [Spinacia oleracea]
MYLPAPFPPASSHLPAPSPLASKSPATTIIFTHSHPSATPSSAKRHAIFSTHRRRATQFSALTTEFSMSRLKSRKTWKELDD